MSTLSPDCLHVDNLECPAPHTWESRRAWFEEAEVQARDEGVYVVSEQACALLVEVQAVFCVGAWADVLVLAMAVVDAQLRESELPGFAGNTARLLDAADADPALQHLRKRRNALVNVKPNSPALTVDGQWVGRSGLEDEARQAVVLMFEAFYIGPWV